VAKRSEILDIARAELDNTDPARYWLDVLDPPVAKPRDAKKRPLSWCGAFALWCLRKAGATAWKWQVGKGFLWRLKRTYLPQPGDIAYIHQPYQHHAIVEQVDGPNVTTIDGNTWGAVKRKERPRPAITAFFSIEPLVTHDGP
jgi:hypothetical protein